jgi:hypothetical protein
MRETNKGAEMKQAKAKKIPVGSTPARQEVVKAVEGMKKEYIECRDLNHSWKDFGAKWYPSFGYYEQILKCLRCDTHKFRYLSASGTVIDSYYEYAPGYLMPHGLGRLSSADRDSFRLASIQGSKLKAVDTGEK